MTTPAPTADDRPVRRRPLAPGLTADATTPPPTRSLPPGYKWIWAGDKWKEYAGDNEPNLPIPPTFANPSWTETEDGVTPEWMPNRKKDHKAIPPRTLRLDGTTLERRGSPSALIGGFRYYCLDCRYETLNINMMRTHQGRRRTHLLLVHALWAKLRLEKHDTDTIETGRRAKVREG
ncbi:MAG: hypothetical protein Q7R39_12880 [Dehalococcoidia bacterium]|nr:hypothetical protein [Dehalococcoidia bacterium]